MSGRIDQVIGEKLAAVESSNPFLVCNKKFGIGGGGEQVFTVDSVAVFSEVADVGSGGRSQIQNAQAFRRLPGARQLSQAAGAAGQFLCALRRDGFRSG